MDYGIALAVIQLAYVMFARITAMGASHTSALRAWPTGPPVIVPRRISLCWDIVTLARRAVARLLQYRAKGLDVTTFQSCEYLTWASHYKVPSSYLVP